MFLEMLLVMYFIGGVIFVFLNYAFCSILENIKQDLIRFRFYETMKIFS